VSFIKPQDKREKRSLDVLVVDDDPGVQALLDELLISMDLSHDIAKSGKDGFQKAMENKYKLILMDLKMENWDGEYAVESLEVCNEDTRVIVVSAFVDDEARSRLNERPNVIGIVDKPFSTDNLSEKIREAIS